MLLKSDNVFVSVEEDKLHKQYKTESHSAIAKWLETSKILTWLPVRCLKIIKVQPAGSAKCAGIKTQIIHAATPEVICRTTYPKCGVRRPTGKYGLQEDAPEVQKQKAVCICKRL